MIGHEVHHTLVWGKTGVGGHLGRINTSERSQFLCHLFLCDSQPGAGDVEDIKV